MQCHMDCRPRPAHRKFDLLVNNGEAAPSTMAALRDRAHQSTQTHSPPFLPPFCSLLFSPPHFCRPFNSDSSFSTFVVVVLFLFLFCQFTVQYFALCAVFCINEHRKCARCACLVKATRDLQPEDAFPRARVYSYFIVVINNHTAKDKFFRFGHVYLGLTHTGGVRRWQPTSMSTAVSECTYSSHLQAAHGVYSFFRMSVSFSPSICIIILITIAVRWSIRPAFSIGQIACCHFWRSLSLN